MNTTHPEFHILQTTMQPCYALQLSISSPFKENTIITATVELHLQPKHEKRFYAELWGDWPFEAPGMPPRRAKFGSGYIPITNPEPQDFSEFMDAVARSLSDCDFFLNGTKAMLTAHELYRRN